MYIKNITYNDFDGNERKEDFLFNMTEAEIAEMQLEKSGGFTTYVNKIIAAQDIPTVVGLFKDLILRSYGEKSADGKYFHKSKEISENFSHTNAYSDLYMELANNSKSASDFINGIMPESVRKEAQKAATVNETTVEAVSAQLYELPKSDNTSN